MKAEFYRDQIEHLLEMVEQNRGDEATAMSSIAISDVSDPAHHDREKAMFRRLPIMVGHSSEVKQPGDFLVKEFDGISWLMVRGKDGIVRAFYNYCRHRGTTLVQEDAGSCAKRFVCPYHAWTYNNQGELIGLPRADLFPGLEKSSKGLKQADLQEAYGFLWLTRNEANVRSVKEYLGGLETEFVAMDLQSHHLYFDKTRQINCNWKLPIFAFLEPYHIEILHKESIAEFFYKNIAVSENLDPHIRSLVPRSNALDIKQLNYTDTKVSEYFTPTDIVFPNVVLIGHPTCVSIISLFPGDSPGTSSWRHMLLTPNQPTTTDERDHYDRTIALLDGITYEKEDFWISQQCQKGIDAGVLDELLLSKNEYLMAVFNDFVNKNI